MNFSRCKLSMDELEKYRDSDGFIDLDKVEIELDESSRNQVGTTDIFKYWVDFAGTKVLLKEEKRLDDEPNYTVYSELIMSELASQMGVEAAMCDLYKYRGKRGIISHLAFEYEREVLEMTDSIIGDTVVCGEYPDISDYAEIEEKIKIALRNEMGLSDEEIKDIIIERRKQKVLQLFAGEADNHTQNEGFIIYKDENGRTCLKVAPMFDNEQSFSLQYTEKDLGRDLERDRLETYETMSLRLLYNQINGRNKSYMLSPEEVEESINVVGESSLEDIVDTLKGNASIRRRVVGNGRQHYTKVNNGVDSLSDITLQYIIDTDDDFDVSIFCDNLINGLDIKNVIDAVERKIKAPIPDIAKETIIRLAGVRIIDFDNVVNGKQLNKKYNRAAEVLKAQAKMRKKAKSNKNQDLRDEG